MSVETTMPARRGRRLGSPPVVLPVAFVLLAIIGLLDYLTGPELQFALFYLIPIALAAWTGGRWVGLMVAACATAVWVTADVLLPHYSHPAIPVWNGGVRLGFFVIFSLLLSAVRSRHDELERAVRKRTNELSKAMDRLAEEARRRAAAEERRRQAEAEVFRAAEREQRRMGRDLHDTIQGNLVGIQMMLGAMRSEAAKSTDQLDGRFERLDGILADTLRQTRNLAHSLCPVDLGQAGLAAALEHLADTTAELFRISCRFHGEQEVGVADESRAAHLYYIAREAVNNAVKHARAGRIDIRLGAADGRVVLSVADDGVGIAPERAASPGLGLRTMAYRAAAIGAELSIRPGEGKGTVVVCSLPAQPDAEPTPAARAASSTPPA